MVERKATDEQRAQAVADYQGGATTREVADTFGVDSKTVSQWLKAAGVPARTSGPTRRNVGDLKAMRDAGMSLDQIATATGLARSAVRKRLGPPDPKKNAMDKQTASLRGREPTLEWVEAPPERQRSQNGRALKWTPIAAQLRATPNEWAIICRGIRAAAASALAKQVRDGQLDPWQPPGHFEAVQRRGDSPTGFANVYARYVGAAQANPR